MINYKVVIKVLGIVILFLGLIMAIPGLIALFASGLESRSLIISSFISMSTGGFLFWNARNGSSDLGKREGYLIVVLAWFGTALFSAFPYFLSGVCPTFVDAFFESVSGLTTTGATIFNDIEAVPKGILAWRSLTQWLGGMGIIVLTVAIFPLLGIGGVELFVAESPGPTSNKIHPRIKETAKRLWLLYVSLTMLLIVVLAIEGMGIFDAVNHGLTTMATGGFSTKNDSMAAFSPIIQYTVLIFMFIAGINYSIIYAGIKGRFGRVWGSDEFKTYVVAVSGAVVLLTTAVIITSNSGFEQAFRDSAFQIVSIVTTTGYVTTDYTVWHPSITLFFFLLLFTGACAGSTAGGIKIVRHLVFAKNSLLEFKRLLHPNALISIRIDKHLVQTRIITNVLVFLLIYLLIFFVATFIMSFILVGFEQPLLSAAGAVATSLGNVGPAIAEFGPVDNFAKMPDAGKWLLTLVMLLGRLELFSVLILFSPYFWRTN
ncbi:MAG: trk system potassium uptake protein TrkH [Limisphaerales bacterium]|jgi:trk system potassium uptake protein TrkH